MRLAQIYRERSLPIQLYSRDFALVFHTCTSTLFCAIGGMVMLVDPSWKLFGSAAFFSLCLTVFIHQHCQGSPFLRLDYGGFVTDSGKSQQKVAWAAVDKFFVVDSHGRKVVGWRYLPNTREYDRFSACGVAPRSIHGCLHYTYGKKPEHLADFMNELCRCHQLTACYLKQGDWEAIEQSQSGSVP